MRAIIPAAGKGTRLHAERQDIPKVMQALCGTPLLGHVLKIVDFLDKSDIYIVVGYRGDQIISYFGDEYRYIAQNAQLGTGHAVMMCADAFRDYEGSVLVTFGDMPLFRRDDVLAMCRAHEESGAACTLMTAENPDLTLWARVIRDADGLFSAIVEGKDCTPEQERVRELFAGVFVFDSKALFEVISEIRPNNVQHEYYLTEVPERMVKRGMKVETFMIRDGNDLRGVNTAEDLVVAEKEMHRRIGVSSGEEDNRHHYQEGRTLLL